MNEIWRDIEGYEGLYQVSNHGRVRSLRGDDVRILKGGTVSGYPVVCLRGQKQETRYVHRLVVDAFLPPDDERSHTNHKDGNRKNNHLSNLERCTPSENSIHARDVLGVLGGNLGRRKLSKAEREQIVALRRQKQTPAQIAAAFGVHAITIMHYVAELAPDAKYINKLSDADVPEIQAMRDRGMKLRAIGEYFGVSESMICRVLKGNRRNRNQEQAS